MKKFPDHYDLIVPTIKALKSMGGSATTTEITKKVIELENFSEEIQNLPQKGDSRTQLEYRLAWARTYLKKFLNGIENTKRNLWTLTDTGHQLNVSKQKDLIELTKKNKTKEIKRDKKTKSVDEDFINTESWRTQLLEIIQNSSAKSFENLCKRVLRESGCINVEVRGGAGDRGIDGTAILKLGLISFPVKFQCKRYGTGNPITPEKIREFRGSLKGIDKGIYLTTSRFTKSAVEEAIDFSEKTIDLIDGQFLCDLLKEYKIGIEEKREVEINEKFFKNI
jgi:restriction system protein